METKNVNASGTPQRWKVLISTFAAYFYDSYSLLAISMVLPTVITLLNITKSQGGMLTSALMVGAMFGSIVMGTLAENRGRKFTIILCLVLFGLMMIPVIFIKNFIAWLIFLALSGVGLGGVYGPCVSLVSEHWNAGYRAKANSLMLSTFALGGIAVALLGRYVVSKDWRILFVVAATSILCAALVYFLVPPDKVKDKNSRNKSVTIADLFKPDVVKLTVAATLVSTANMAGFWGVNGWVPTYLKEVRGLTTESMANFTLVIYIGMFIGYQVWSAVADKVGRKKVIGICLILDAASIVLYLILPIYIVLWWGMLVGFSFGGVMGVMGAFFSELFTGNVRSIASGFCFNIGRIGSVIAPLLIGTIGDHFGLKAGLMVGPVFFLLGIFALTFLPETKQAGE